MKNITRYIYLLKLSNINLRLFDLFKYMNS